MNVWAFIHLPGCLSVHPLHFIRFIFPLFAFSLSDCLILSFHLSLRLRCFFYPFDSCHSYALVLSSSSGYIFDASSLSVFVSHSYFCISATCLCKSMFLSVAVCKIRTFSLKENKIMWVQKVCLHLIFLVLHVSERTVGFQDISRNLYLRGGSE
jgi:hypothetical protein